MVWVDASGTRRTPRGTSPWRTGRPTTRRRPVLESHRLVGHAGRGHVDPVPFEMLLHEPAVHLFNDHEGSLEEHRELVPVVDVVPAVRAPSGLHDAALPAAHLSSVVLTCLADGSPLLELTPQRVHLLRGYPPLVAGSGHPLGPPQLDGRLQPHGEERRLVVGLLPLEELGLRGLQ